MQTLYPILVISEQLPMNVDSKWVSFTSRKTNKLCSLNGCCLPDQRKWTARARIVELNSEKGQCLN